MELVRISLMISPMVAGLATVIGVLTWSRRARLAGRRSPLTQGLLRPPGHETRRRFDDLFVDLMGWLMAALAMPAMLGTFAAFNGLTRDGSIDWVALSIFLGSAIFVICLSAYKLVKINEETMNLRMGWDAEMAAGQELDQLMRKGAFVFHDLSATAFNVDHVLICSAGVYAIETKSRMKPQQVGKESARVVVDGAVLKFPGWSETAPIEQARRQAKWLSKGLTKAVGEEVQVAPVLALPGWFVEEFQRGDVRVINPKNFHFLLQSRGPQLTTSMIERIAHQIEQRCRNVAPAFTKNGETATL